jgi:hypothetical protein
MAVYGTGIVPNQTPYGQELSYVTRRGFVPKMVVQIYNASPMFAGLLANAQTALGGVSSVSVPLQGTPFVNSQWTDFSGTFGEPAQQQGAYLAEFNLKALITPIQFLGMEGALQLDHAVVPLIEARMNDAGNSACDAFGQALFNNYTNNLQLIGLPGAVDDTTNLTIYGNVNRGLNTWWKSTVYNATGSPIPTRKNVMQYIIGVNKYGAEMPTMGVMGPGTWAYLSQDFVGNESYQLQPGMGFDSDSDRPRSGFRALDIAGVPIYVDPYCPEGTMYLLNTNYLNLYVHEQASFSFTGFDSLMPNFQLGYIGAVLTLAELVCTKPKTCGRVYNYSSLTI